MSVETVARRYATALADVVTKTGETENVRGELQQWEAMINANAELLNAFRNPAIQQNQKEKVLDSLIQRSKPMQTTANFLRVLLRNGRLGEIAQINQKFASVLEERQGGVSAKIVSARPLSEGEKQELRANLEKMTGKRVSPSFEIDNNIIGGVVTTIGSTVYDGSVKTQLQTLKEQMIRS
jgi:F-type H+-transporting ATPase subunit delta